MRQQAEEYRHLRLTQRLFGIGLALLSGACTGQILSDANETGASGAHCPGGKCAGPGAGPNAGGGTTGAADVGPGEVPMRRLNNAEYENTVRDLLATTGPTVTFPEEGRTQGFDTLSTALAVSPLHIQAYLDAASEVITEVFEKGAVGLLGGDCDYLSADVTANLACAQQIVTDFAARVWRRDHSAWPDPQPASDYLRLLEVGGPLAELSLEVRLRTALEAVLVSPRFVYRVEYASAEGKLDTPSLASRLSYLLWSSAPDPELLASDLQQSAVLETHVARMQDDPRFERFLDRFPAMWLELEKLEAVERDQEVYPSYSPELVLAMAEETRDFVASYWRNEGATVSGILLAPSTAPADSALAQLYGGSPRLGLITQASIMTLTGASNRTAPVRRGKWVLERLLCAPPPPPPDGLIAELTAELEADDSLTERERLERHRVSPACAGCHSLMDPVGLGFENYDSVGAYRSVDHNGEPIDASGVLPDGTTFAGPMELIELLATDDRVVSCVIRQLLTYGTGRVYDSNDEALVEAARLSAGGEGATFESVLSSVVQSDAFRRRIEEE